MIMIMHEIKASVILAENIENNSIINIIDELSSYKNHIIYMYLTIKTKIEDNDEIKIGFDIIQLSGEEDNFGIEIGEFVIGKTNDENKQQSFKRELKVKSPIVEKKEFKYCFGRCIYYSSEISATS